MTQRKSYLYETDATSWDPITLYYSDTEADSHNLV